MPEGHWEQIWTLFEEAQSRPAEARAAFLAAQCQDAAVREEVVSLLEAYEEAPDFLEGIADAVITPALSELGIGEGPDLGARRDPLRLEGTAVGHYTVEEHLGQGGMGVVYRACDTHLSRPVALKFLPLHLATHPEADERFVREARSAAALDHPNIATIHEIGTTDEGRRFIAMAYYAGETLKEKLARDGALPVEEALAVTVQIARGLQRAHEAGIVHRDVKPANVMLTERGAVKLLDFGLARAADQSALTTPGRRLGTAAYMSPEQARCEPVDARTDLWALGAILYEMLTGGRPFRGTREVSVLHAILHEEPAPLSESRGAVPADLQMIVERCLQKNPGQRYASAEDLLADLEALRSGTGSGSPKVRTPRVDLSRRVGTHFMRPGWFVGAATVLVLAVALGWALWPGTPAQDGGAAASLDRSVAVLPFTHLSADDSTDYFSLGITEEILTRLAQVSDLSVISRTSVMQYQNTDKNLREIGDELGVAAVVEGSVQQVGDRIRIHAQLIDAEADRHIWSESYDRRLEDILAVQSEVALRVAEALQAELLPQEQAQLTVRRDVDETAYHLYLRAQHLRDWRDSVGVAQAATLYRTALRHDETFAPAHAGLAMTFSWSGLFRWIPRETAGPEALRAAGRALALDSTVVEAHLAEALVYQLFTREWDRSEQAFKRALALNPSHSEARSEYGWQLLRLGRVNEALAQMKQAVAVDPLSWHAHHSLGYAYYCHRQYEDAIRELETALNIEARFPPQRLYLFHALIQKSQRLFRQGKDEEAEAYLKRVYEIKGELSDKDMEWLHLIEEALKGRKEQGRERLHQVSDPVQKLALALLVGQNQPALDLIEQYISFDGKSYADPIFDPVRDAPRFEAIVEEKLGRDVDLR